jgi:hypothetical protein
LFGSNLFGKICSRIACRLVLGFDTFADALSEDFLLAFLELPNFYFQNFHR